MDSILAYVQLHLIAFAVGYYVFMAIVSTMPKPTPTSSVGYVWLYGLLHALSGNAMTVFTMWKANAQPPAPPQP